jgi:peptidoglycan/LPS O-acetylase OafA/YrhL
MIYHYSEYIGYADYFRFFGTGVDLFFIISGFVFARQIYQGTDKFSAFVIRRFFRIYPLYLFSLLIALWLTEKTNDYWWIFIKHLFFLGTTKNLYEAVFFNGVYWTLSVEIEFYLLVPVLAFYRKKIPYLLFGSFVLYVLFRTLYMVDSSTLDEPTVLHILMYHLPGTLGPFILGVWLYRLNMSYLFNSSQIRLTTFCIGLVMIGFVAYGYYIAREMMDYFFLLKAYLPLLSGFAYALILFAFLPFQFNEKGYWRKFCLFLGNISYGIYLFHLLTPKLFALAGWSQSGYYSFTAYVISTTICAWLMFHILENPARQFGKKLSKRL